MSNCIIKKCRRTCELSCLEVKNYRLIKIFTKLLCRKPMQSLDTSSHPTQSMNLKSIRVNLFQWRIMRSRTKRITSNQWLKATRMISIKMWTHQLWKLKVIIEKLSPNRICTTWLPKMVPSQCQESRRAHQWMQFMVNILERICHSCLPKCTPWLELLKIKWIVIKMIEMV